MRISNITKKEKESFLKIKEEVKKTIKLIQNLRSLNCTKREEEAMNSFLKGSVTAIKSILNTPNLARQSKIYAKLQKGNVILANLQTKKMFKIEQEKKLVELNTPKNTPKHNPDYIPEYNPDYNPKCNSDNIPLNKTEDKKQNYPDVKKEDNYKIVKKALQEDVILKKQNNKKLSKNNSHNSSKFTPITVPTFYINVPKEKKVIKANRIKQKINKEKLPNNKKILKINKKDTISKRRNVFKKLKAFKKSNIFKKLKTFTKSNIFKKLNVLFTIKTKKPILKRKMHVTSKISNKNLNKKIVISFQKMLNLQKKKRKVSYKGII